MDELHDQLTPDDVRIGDRLARERPAPAAGFRGALGRHLRALDPGYGPRPGSLDLMVSGSIAVGVTLMVLGLLQAAGAL
jgi:hypothetical protein